ncbi:asparaginase domain-containing protein [Paenibacillus filicis]|uniref:Asparaginase domain-containing protein n=1 Tax=Paenibacillus filicis TaxID=669464 RepID=A0ABU9DF19_9BACL
MTYIQNHSASTRRYVPLLLLTLIAAASTIFSSPSAVKAEQLSAKPPVASIPLPELTEDFKQSPLPNVIVIGTGGTLAGKAADATSFQNYRAGTFPIADLVGQLPNKSKIADVASAQFGNKGSGAYTLADLYDLSQTVDAALAQYDGAVVTTGTDTMEEIAYFLDLTVRSEKPVVVTGAMRPWDVIGTDAPANLYNAIKLAGSGKTKSYGTVIMLNDVIQAARDVTKSNSHRMDTFNTPMLGALGYIDESNIRMYRLTNRALKAGSPEWATPFDLTTITKDKIPPVEIAYAYQDAGGGAITQFVQDGVKGIVTSGTGAGGLSSKMSAARSKAIQQGVIFVTTTRTGSGTMYGSSNGIIAGDSLNAPHARILLAVSMAFSSDFQTIKGYFETVGNQDITMKPVPAEDKEAPVWPPGIKLIASDVSQTAVTLAWPAAQDNVGVSKYRVYEAGSNLPLATVSTSVYASTGSKGKVQTSVYGSVYENVYAQRITGLNPGTLYTFSVKAVDEAGNESTALTQGVTTLSSNTDEGSSNGGSGSGSGPVTAPVQEKKELTLPAGEGGTIDFKNVTIKIPAGAAGQELKLSVQQVEDVSGLVTKEQVLLSPVFELLKNFSGSFDKPVSVTLPFEAGKLKPGQVPAVFYFDEAKKAWTLVGIGTVSGGRITVEVDHFTKFAVFGVDAPVEKPLVSFTDLAGHWSEEAVKKAAALGIVSGYPDGSFKPDGAVTRAEFTLMLMTALGPEANAPATKFADQNEIGTWAAQAIAQAVQQGAIQGYEDGTFRPGARINRAEMAVMIAGAKGLKLQGGAATGFADDGDIPAWAKGAVDAIRKQGIVEGRSGGEFAPAASATRGEAATIILKLLPGSR